MHYSRILILFMTLLIGALAAPIRSRNKPKHADNEDVVLGNPSKVYYDGLKLRLDYRDEDGHEGACSGSTTCNIKIKNGKLLPTDQDRGNPNLVTYEGGRIDKRIKFNYEDRKHRDNCGEGKRLVCYLPVELDWSAV